MATQEVYSIENRGFEPDEPELATANNIVPDEQQDRKEIYSNKERDEGDIISSSIQKFWNSLDNFYKRHKQIFSITFLTAIAALFLAYFIAALVYKSNQCKEEQRQKCDWKWCTEHGFLIIIVSLTVLGLVYYKIIKRFFAKTIDERALKPIAKRWADLRQKRFTSPILVVLVFALIILFLALDTKGERQRLKSVFGLFVLLFLGTIFSRHPGKIHWQPVITGLLLQFAFGLITLRWEPGRMAFKCFGDKVEQFLNYTNEGAGFVYGDYLANNVFAFQVLPVIFFFSFCVQILYYWGVMQFVVMKLGWILQVCMGTTVCESVNTAASIFLGQSEAPLIIKPYIHKLTKSEIHAIMTAGFATVSGSVMAAYAFNGVSASHLLTASIMSAPAALCYSKLFYPESEESQTRLDNIQLEKGDETGVLDAATKGAMSAISLVLGIIANIVAFVSAINFLDGIIGWLGELVGLTGDNEISFTFILTKIFYPLVWVMGVEDEECSDVAKVVALKTVVNEFVAYKELGIMLENGALSGRSELIATYALCGFSNPGSIGIIIGALSTMAPNRRADISEVAFRAFIAGSAVCFLTACVAGALVAEVTSDGNSTLTTEGYF